MQITQEWLQEIQDDQGLTKGQEYLLYKWTKESDWVGKEIPDQVASFLVHCKGYRELPRYVKEFKGWIDFY
jgi:hypothetical protein